MYPTTKSLFQFTLFAFALLSITIFSACDDDDLLLPETYDGTKHIYGTIADFSNDNQGVSEVIIDPQTGAFSTLEGTESGLIIAFPSGTKNLFDFARNRRVYWDVLEFRLVIQDLETLEKTAINVSDPANSVALLNPQFVTFGANNDVVYIYDTTGDLWAIDLITETPELLYSRLDFGELYVDNQLYLASTNQLVYGAHPDIVNRYVSSAIYTLDLATGELQNLGDIEETFGWAKDPQDERIYGLRLATDETGFRLVELELTGSEASTRLLSQEDLAISSLSAHTQTIHTATNTYICRGGSTREGMNENNIYSIDLSSGELIRTVSIGNKDQLILNIDGE
ncbi:MAG: hypothetical protein AAFP77_20885 [Bacteroidota bacterium]